MLLLDRNLGDKIVIGDDIFITIVRLNKGQVKIGIEAPKNISVHRKEIYDAILKEKISMSENGK